MKYVKAKNVLPQNIIETIQNYIDGEYLYIPRKEGNERAWGEKSGARKNLKARNIEIYKKFTYGLSVDELCKEYYLSESSIRRIIRSEKSVS
ncbi:CD3324 family protein [Dethiothermospora halolimnae]|uniref:CD3324 family protein n=1 Tax=Dethiothermospora halolimnae TaxID=3114390 RepID=UPI003CCB7928